MATKNRTITLDEWTLIIRIDPAVVTVGAIENDGSDSSRYVRKYNYVDLPPVVKAAVDDLRARGLTALVNDWTANLPNEGD